MQSAAITVFLAVAVLAAVFGMYNAHLLHVASLEKRVVSLHVASLEKRVVSLEKQIEYARTREALAAGKERFSGDYAETLNANHIAAERAAEVRHIRTLYVLTRHYYSSYNGHHGGLFDPQKADFEYDIAKKAHVYGACELHREWPTEACSDADLIWRNPVLGNPNDNRKCTCSDDEVADAIRKFRADNAPFEAVRAKAFPLALMRKGGYTCEQAHEALSGIGLSG